MELVLFFIKAKTVLFLAAVCVVIATEIWNRPMDIICSNTWYLFIRGSARVSLPKMSIPIKVATTRKSLNYFEYFGHTDGRIPAGWVYYKLTL